MSISIDALRKNGFNQLPDVPGVYFFVAEKNEILYIGKATSLRDRVRSYFSQDIARTRGPKIVSMLERVREVRVRPMDSVLEALLLESHLIKKYQPTYNTDEKDDKSFLYAVITKEKFPRVLLKRGRDLATAVTSQKPLSKSVSYKYIFGPFPSGGSLKEALKIVRRIFPFRDTCDPASGKSCFNHQISLCPGVCAGTITAEEYTQTIRNIKLFFEGKKTTLVRQLNKEMKAAISALAFEKANELKKTLFALGHIRDVSLLKKEISEEKLFRIEAYDAAHMAGREVVGVMTVVEDGLVNKAEYRKFHIYRGTGNDLASLEQILRRRLRHSEWRLPNLIVVDGFDLQIGVAQQIVAELGLHIPIVGVVKDSRHRPKDILGDTRMAKQYSDAILLANSEAHRFAIGFHRQTRGKKFLEK